MKFIITEANGPRNGERGNRPEKAKLEQLVKIIFRDKKYNWSHRKPMNEICDNVVETDLLWLGELKEREECWTIEFKDLKELMKYVDSIPHDIIISKELFYKGIDGEIEIYNDYRES